jgi:hypothetical protein
MKLTQHGCIRVRERLGIEGCKAREVINRAFLNGTPRKSLVGRLRKWVDVRYFNHKQIGHHFVYGGYIYVFNDDRELITTYEVPVKILQNPMNKKFKLRQIRQKKVSEAALL